MASQQHSSPTPSIHEKGEVKQYPEEADKPIVGDKTISKSTGIPGIILAIVCLVLEAIIFLFCVVGTPIDAFKGRKGPLSSSCYSMWGSKQCGSHKTNPAKSPYKGFPTSNIRDTMNAAAAFAIISIFVTLVALVLTVLLVCKCIFRVIPGIFSVVAFITLLIVWACQAGAYNKKYNQATIGSTRYYSQIKIQYKYGGSFGLFVTAWCLQTIQMVLVFFA